MFQQRTDTSLLTEHNVTVISFNSCVPMDKIFHRDSDLTCLQKVIILGSSFLIISQEF